MKLSSLVVASCLAVLGSSQILDIGSTPSERFQINQTQALQIIEAANEQSINLSTPVNIAVADAYG